MTMSSTRLPLTPSKESVYLPDEKVGEIGSVMAALEPGATGTGATVPVIRAGHSATFRETGS
jgi:hypothetical protein